VISLPKYRKTNNKYLTCAQCKNKCVIHRLSGQNRAEKHPKHLYCHICKDRTLHFESKYDSSFQPLVERNIFVEVKEEDLIFNES
jgi:uncharacterized CHY-type Zn-finger protein